MSPEEARNAALKQFGGVEQIKEACRDEARYPWVEHFGQDARYAVRQLRKNRGFSVAAVIVLGLGIGANAAVFNLVHSLLFAPPNYAQPDEIVRVFLREKKNPKAIHDISYPLYREIHSQNGVFSGMLAFKIAGIGLGEKGAGRRAIAALVTSNYFAVLGVAPAQGRTFLSEEESLGRNAAVTIVSYSFWKKRNFDPQIVGATVQINGRKFTVVGVMPKGFVGTPNLFATEVWMPLGDSQVIEDLPSDGDQPATETRSPLLTVFGRLNKTAAIPSALVGLRGLTANLARVDQEELKDRSLDIEPPSRFATSDNDRSVAFVGAVLLAMAFLVLLVACLNLSSMLLARGAARRKEIAIRLALGGGRSRIVRQLLTEGLVLALVGGAFGLVLAIWASDILIASLGHLAPIDLAWTARPQASLLAATFGFCVLGTLCFALAPALKLTRSNVITDLKANPGEDVVRRRWRFLPRNPLVVAQIALSLSLLTVSALFVHGASKAASVDTGLKTDRNFIVEIDASLGGRTPRQAQDSYRILAERFATLPGVESASIATDIPFSGLDLEKRVQRIGTTGSGTGGSSSSDNKGVSTKWNSVGADYFKTVGLPMLRGRAFSLAEATQSGGPPVAIISEVLAKKLWPEGDALGERVRFVPDTSGPEPSVPGPGAKDSGNGEIKPGEMIEVVGVVPAVRHLLFAKSPDPDIYLPFARGYQSHVFFHIKFSSVSADAEATIADLLLRTAHSVDETSPVISVKSFARHLDTNLQIWMARAAAALFSVFGVLALILAVVGTYGVMAYSVTRRFREIGIRMALGALPAKVGWMVLQDGLVMLAVGAAFGFVLALGIGRVVSSLLYGVGATDPLAFSVAPAVLGVATILACWIPAWRATQIDPLVVLRAE